MSKVEKHKTIGEKVKEIKRKFPEKFGHLPDPVKRKQNWTREQVEILKKAIALKKEKSADKKEELSDNEDSGDK